MGRTVLIAILHRRVSCSQGISISATTRELVLSLPRTVIKGRHSLQYLSSHRLLALSLLSTLIGSSRPLLGKRISLAHATNRPSVGLGYTSSSPSSSQHDHDHDVASRSFELCSETVCGSRTPPPLANFAPKPRFQPYDPTSNGSPLSFPRRGTSA
jgi:hypothetical protein